MSSQERPLRVAFIGAGAIVKIAHIPNFAAVPETDLVALCDVNEGRVRELANEHGIPGVYTDYRRMLEEVKPDITVVATPNIFHKEMAIAALESGSNVLCEKPVAPTYAEAVEMFEAAEKAGRVLTVGSHFRFGANTQIARRQADAGFFGNIYAARTTWHRRSGIPGMGGWFTNRDLAMGGVLFDLGVHALDRALYIMDYPQPVTVSGALFAEFGPRGLGAGGWGMDAMQPVAQERRRFDVEDLAWAFVRFANGAVLQFQVAWAAHFPDFWTTELFGSEGGARLNEQNEIELYSSVNGQDAVIQVKGPDKAPWSYAEQVRHFVRHLQGDPSAEIVTPEQALISVRIVDAIARSATAEHEVTL